MGAWGPGVFDNDHALDLFSIEVDRVAGMMEAILSREGAAFDDIEGPLLYVHMLLLFAQERELRQIDRGVVARWRDKYLHIFNSTIGSDYPDSVAKRREVIAREFDLLAARLPDASTVRGPTDAVPKPLVRRSARRRPGSRRGLAGPAEAPGRGREFPFRLGVSEHDHAVTATLRGIAMRKFHAQGRHGGQDEPGRDASARRPMAQPDREWARPLDGRL